MPVTGVIDVTGRVPGEQAQLLASVYAAAKRRGVELLLIGAIARDFITHHHWGADAGRATKDIDFAVQASTWDEYALLQDALVDEAFIRTGVAHQLEHNGVKVDLVPFGAITAPDGVLAWPPDGQPQMSTAGLLEAFQTAIVFEHRAPSAWTIRVPAPPTFLGLKVLAWADRGHDKSKDAEDIDFVLTQAGHVASLVANLYDEHQDVLELESFDTDLAIAHLLGRQAASLFLPATREKLVELLAPEVDASSTRLSTAMVQGHRPGQPDPYRLQTALARLKALHHGLTTGYVP